MNPPSTVADIAIKDIYLDNDCNIHFKYSNDGSTPFNSQRGLSVAMYVNNNLVYNIDTQNAIPVNLAPGASSEINTQVKVSGSPTVQVKLTPIYNLDNPANNSMTKTLTCKTVLKILPLQKIQQDLPTLKNNAIPQSLLDQLRQTDSCTHIAFIIQSPPSGTVNQPYSYTLQTAGGHPPITFSLDPQSKLPTGLSLSSGGIISGVPTTSGNYPFIVWAQDSCQKVQSTFTITIVSPVVTCPPLTITTQSLLQSGTVNQPYNYQLRTSGGQAPITFSLDPQSKLPPGLNLSSTGVISGLPTTAGNYPFIVWAQDSCQKVKGNFTITIASPVVTCPPLTITAQSQLQSGTLNQPYNYQLRTSGAYPPVTFSLDPQSKLPPWLTLSSGGVISGTPIIAGTYIFTVWAQDSCPTGAQKVSMIFILMIY